MPWVRQGPPPAEKSSPSVTVSPRPGSSRRPMTARPPDPPARLRRDSSPVPGFGCSGRRASCRDGRGRPGRGAGRGPRRAEHGGAPVLARLDQARPARGAPRRTWPPRRHGRRGWALGRAGRRPAASSTIPSVGHMTKGVVAAVAQSERDLLVERTQPGARAMRRGTRRFRGRSVTRVVETGPGPWRMTEQSGASRRCGAWRPPGARDLLRSALRGAAGAGRARRMQ